MAVNLSWEEQRMYLPTTAYKKISSLTKRIRGISGGSSASKTISILQWLIDASQSYHGNLLSSVVSETMPHLRRGALRDFTNIMQEHEYYEESRFNKTDSIYDFSSFAGGVLQHKKLLEFFSADQPGKVRGPRRDILFINEANNLTYDKFTQLEIRTNKIIWLDWNPVTEFWWYIGEEGEIAVKDRPDADFLILTYLDNEGVPQAIRRSIESHKNNKNWWNVYGLGIPGVAEGRIYKDWQVIDEIPHEARLERYGLDFGYSNDPTAIIAIYYLNGGYIVDEITFQKELSNKQIADILKNQTQAIVIADSAEPKSIDEIKSYGVNIIPVVKGKDSVTQGIQYVQDQRISVTKHSTNIIKEYRNYLWKTDKDGKTLNEPEDIWDHAMDAIRYGFDSIHPVSTEHDDINKGLTKKWRI